VISGFFMDGRKQNKFIPGVNSLPQEKSSVGIHTPES
jgi:hypothetical protein